MVLFEFFKSFKEAPLKKKLRLPKRFVRLYSETLANEVFLKPTQGSECFWEIGLAKSNGKVWLKQGWPEFARRFALGEGRFALFRYDGNSKFAVSVCDNRKSTAQIYCGPDVPASSDETDVDGSAEEPSMQGTECDHAIESSDSLWLPYSDEEEGSSSSCSSTRKRMRTRANGRSKNRTARNFVVSEDSVFQLENRRHSGDSHFWKVDGPVEGKPGVGTKFCKRSQSSEDNLNSGNPSFTVLLKPTHISRRLLVPMKFWMEYMNQEEGNVVLYGSDGGAWTVHIAICHFGNRGDERPVFSYVTWRKFVQDNNLAIGDFCTFELINQRKISFKVTVSGVAKGSNCKPSLGKFRKLNSDYIGNHPDCGRKTYSASAAEKLSSRNPFFQATIPKYANKMYVPRSFGLKHFEPNMRTVRLQVRNRLWPVGLFESRGKYYLSRGFINFVEQNSLCSGDDCVFELISANPTVLEVTVFRHGMV